MCFLLLLLVLLLLIFTPHLVIIPLADRPLQRYLPRGNQWSRNSSVGNTYGANAPPPALLSRNKPTGAVGGATGSTADMSPVARAAMMTRPSSAQQRPPKAPVNKDIFTPFVGRSDEVLAMVPTEFLLVEAARAVAAQCT